MGIWHRLTLGLPLSNVVYKCLLDCPITAEDVQQLDPDFFKQRLARLLAPGGADALAELMGERLTFMSAGTDWRPEPVPLVKGGEDLIVTEMNKLDYAVRLCEDYLIGGIRLELAEIVGGFADIIPLDALRKSRLSPSDLQLLLEGASIVDIDQLRAVSLCQPNDELAKKHMVWFFDVIESFDGEQRAKVIRFTTGASILPAEGPGSLRPPFTISVNSSLRADLLPTSHTCFNMLCLPVYSSKDVLRDKLLCAINSDAGFGFE